MISRTQYIQDINRAYRVHSVVATLGPRQCGKTTLAKEYIQIYNSTQTEIPATNYFDLEDPTDLKRLKEPKSALQGLTGLIIIDEVQRVPELFPLLRVFVDNNTNQRYLILGSASHHLLKQTSESLAGRIQYLSLPPFNLTETDNVEQLWYRGGFPKSYLAINNDDSLNWRQSYIQTFLERDLPLLGVKLSSVALHEFWMMLAHYHGGITNYSELGRSLQIS